MGIINYLLGRNKLPFNKEVKFTRVETDFDLIIGEKLKLWNKPNTNRINLYVKGTVGGEGLVGYTNNSVIRHHLKNKKYLSVTNIITKINFSKICINIQIFDKRAKGKDDSLVNDWRDKMQKKYNPKTNWEIRFYSENALPLESIKVKSIKADQIDEFYGQSDKLVWLTGKNNIVFDAENRISQISTEKTLRAIFTGHEIEIKNIEVGQNWYNLTVGIKK